jgi:dTDP-4-dehydrorhamnose reductase
MKIFILGANGMLGRYVTKVLNKNYQIKALTRDDYGDQSQKVNLIEHLQHVVTENDVIINCIGAIKQKDFTNMGMFNLNTIVPAQLMLLQTWIGCKVIHITTDCVFDGKRGNYYEDDKPNATDPYGIYKASGEFSAVTNIRTSIIGEEKQSKRSFLEWIKSNRGGKINGYTNHMWNGMTCLELCGVISMIIDLKFFWSGVRHVISPQPISKFELARMINKHFNLGINIIPTQAVESIDRTLASKYPHIFDISDYDKQIFELTKFSID